MKNHIKYKIAGVAMLLNVAFISSCNDFLDIQPVSQVSEARFWKSNNDAIGGVAGIYDAMQVAYSSNYYLWGEFRSDNYVRGPRITGQSLELLTNDLQPSNGAVLNWTNLYSMINKANIAITYIPEIPGADPNLLAQAYALRAYAYFDAVRVWGKAPLYLESIKGLADDVYRTQTDGAKIITDVIIPDINKAEQLMTTLNSDNSFSKASIYCLQADIYWYLNDFPKAKIALDKFTALNAQTNLYKLVTTRDAWGKQFLAEDEPNRFEISTETVFSLIYSLGEDGQQAGNRDLFMSPLPQFAVSALVENKWKTAFPTDSISWNTKYPANPPIAKDGNGAPLYGDWRYFETVERNKLLGEARVAKYQKIMLLNFDGTDTHIYRYSAILLLQAIVENRLNNKQVAVDLLNRIRVARQLPTVKSTDFTSVDQLEDRLLDERQFELMGEGKRWWDLISAKKAVAVMSPINGQGDNKLFFPVFSNHIIDNQKLTQTTGYN